MLWNSLRTNRTLILVTTTTKMTMSSISTMSRMDNFHTISFKFSVWCIQGQEAIDIYQRNTNA